MTCIPDNFGKVMVFVAHPDDETIACSGLLQRATVSLVVFGVDGAPPHYGFEKKFGSLAHYSEVRYLEASRALASIPECSFRRLTRQDGSWFVDQHLFMELPEAFTSLCKIAGEFQPDLLISHAFEGGHLDHDTCHVLAKSLAQTLAVGQLEFPLYWNSKPGQDVFQEFREPREDDFVVQLSQTELIVKRRMLTEYRTQQNIASVFHPETERFRPVAEADGSKPTWSTYPFQNRGKPWKAGLFFQKIDDFQRFVSTSARREIVAIKE